jgi:endonuclease/exonuclease/phosphatase family metal-dependent hydrolase
VICELDCDVVALQEVDSRYHAEGCVDQFERLAELTKLRAIAGPALRDHRGHYGNALLTRLPVVRVSHFDLSVGRREPRSALDVVLAAPGAVPLRVVATHLGLSGRERRAQIRRLLQILGERPLPARLVLLGDMNEWHPFAPRLGQLNASFHTTRRVRSFPAHCPLLALDQIWVTRPGRLLAPRAHRSPLARIASDHLPIRAELWQP